MPALASGTGDEGGGEVKIAGRMELPGGTLGGFRETVEQAARSAGAGRATKPKWSLEESAKAPWNPVQAPKGTATGADATVTVEPPAA